MLDLIGDSVACGDVKNPQAGTAVTVRLNMEVASNRYVATSAQGGLVLRLERERTAELDLAVLSRTHRNGDGLRQTMRAAR